MKRKILAALILLSLCMPVSGCVSDKEYENLEKRVTYLENLSGASNSVSVDNSETGPTDNDNSDANNTEPTAEVSSQEPEFYYYVDELSAEEVAAEVESLLDNKPYKGQSFEDYGNGFNAKVRVDQSINYFGPYYFYSDGYDGVPDKDAITQIDLGGVSPQMDGTIGFEDLDGEKYVDVKVYIAIYDYDKAEKTYDCLYDYLTPFYEPGGDDRETTQWRSWGSIHFSSNFSRGVDYLSMYKREKDYLIQATMMYPMNE